MSEAKRFRAELIPGYEGCGNDGYSEVVLASDYARLERRARELEAVLTRIACFDDEYANDRLRRDGIYYSFDEPNSVEIARLALAKREGA